MKHPALEELNDHVDGELSDNQESELVAHLAGCDTCRAAVASIRRAVATLASLEPPSLTAADHRALRTRLLETKPTRVSPAWKAALGGVAVLAVIAALAFLFVPRPQESAELGRLGTDSAAQGEPLVFTSDAEIRDVVSSQPEVKAAAGRYRVLDVGSRQEPAIERAVTALSARSDSESSGGTYEQAPSKPAADRSAESCVRKVLQTQPHAMLPLLARPAKYKGADAWVVVFAWTPSAEEDAPLDRLQVWVLSPKDCATLNYSQQKL